MKPISLTAGLAALALTTTLVGSNAVAQQSGWPRGERPSQAMPEEPAGADGQRRPGGPAEHGADDRDDDPEESGAHADDDEPAMRRAPRSREERDDGGRRGFAGPPRGEMMARRAMAVCGSHGNRMVAMMLMRLERTANPTEAQRAAFDKLKDAAARAGEVARAGCPAERPITPTGRLAAAEKRLEAMLAAIRVVRPPLEEFFALLSDEQKASFYASLPRAHSQDYRGWREPPRGEQGSPRRDRWRDERGEDGRRDGRDERRRDGRGDEQGDRSREGERWRDDRRDERGERSRGDRRDGQSERWRDDDRDEQAGRPRDGGRDYGPRRGRDRDRDGWPDQWRGRL